MQELTPDPVADTLARFTPDASAVDPADILFNAGRASVQTPKVWKLAVAGLLLTNLIVVGLLTFRDWTAEPRSYAPPPLPEAVAVPVVVPVPVDSAAPPSPAAPEAPSRYSLGAMLGTTDPDRLPKTEPVTGMVPDRPPLTPLAARGRELD